MSRAACVIAEAQKRREQALAEGDEDEVRKCDAQIARWERVKQDVDKAPALAPEIRDRLRVLLRPAPAERPAQPTSRQLAA